MGDLKQQLQRGCERRLKSNLATYRGLVRQNWKMKTRLTEASVDRYIRRQIELFSFETGVIVIPERTLPNVARTAPNGIKQRP